MAKKIGEWKNVIKVRVTAYSSKNYTDDMVKRDVENLDINALFIKEHGGHLYYEVIKEHVHEIEGLDSVRNVTEVSTIPDNFKKGKYFRW